MYSRILLAYDGSSDGRRALDQTAELARQTLPTLRKHLQVAESLQGRG